MKIEEAKEECKRWLAYLQRQREKTLFIQQLASDRKSGKVTLDEARKQLRIMDGSPVVYDGARLAEAVKVLIGE